MVMELIVCAELNLNRMGVMGLSVKVCMLLSRRMVPEPESGELELSITIWGRTEVPVSNDTFNVLYRMRYRLPTSVRAMEASLMVTKGTIPLDAVIPDAV